MLYAFVKRKWETISGFYVAYTRLKTWKDSMPLAPLQFFLFRDWFTKTLSTQPVFYQLTSWGHPPAQTAPCSRQGQLNPLYCPTSHFMLEYFKSGLLLKNSVPQAVLSPRLYLPVPSSCFIAFGAPTSQQQQSQGTGRHPAVTMHWHPMLLPEFPARQPELERQHLPRLSERGSIFVHCAKPAPLGSSPAGQLLL